MAEVRNPIEALLRRLGARLAHFLSKPVYQDSIPVRASGDLPGSLIPGDVLLVEGRSRISAAIKYLTQSTWSHAALVARAQGGVVELIEADVEQGVVRVPLAKYDGHNVRICRPVGLDDGARERVVAYAAARLGHRYDLRNVFDLMRFLLPEPPVPVPLRPRLLTLGSGDPTRAICSTLLAAAFQAEAYPILPEAQTVADPYTGVRSTLYRQRHASFATPRDFDLSPYFAVIKPTLHDARDYRDLHLIGPGTGER